MKPGTPGFVGSRLREARESRGLSAQQLAELLDVTRSAISQYESGHSTPHPKVMGRLAQALNFPPGFFMLPPRTDDGDGAVFFRSRVATKRSSRARVTARLNWLADIVSSIATRLTLPVPNFPMFDIPDPRRFSDDDIEQFASETRQHWGLGEAPIANVVWLLESHGAITTRGEIHEPLMDSFSRWKPSDPHPLIFLNADKSSGVRSRFDASHELGHLLLHRQVPEDYWGGDERLRELQADQFASAFLLSRNAFQRDVGYASLDRFLAIKRKWRVSVAAMLRRSQSLGLVGDSQAERLWMNLGRRRWRTREPLDDELEFEAPRLLRRAFDVLASHDPLGTRRVLDDVQLSERDVAELAMLEGPIDSPIDVTTSSD